MQVENLKNNNADVYHAQRQLVNHMKNILNFEQILFLHMELVERRYFALLYFFQNKHF